MSKYVFWHKLRDVFSRTYNMGTPSVSCPKFYNLIHFPWPLLAFCHSSSECRDPEPRIKDLAMNKAESAPSLDLMGARQVETLSCSSGSPWKHHRHITATSVLAREEEIHLLPCHTALLAMWFLHIISLIKKVIACYVLIKASEFDTCSTS